MTPIFCRIWLVKMTVVLERLFTPLSFRLWGIIHLPSISKARANMATESIDDDINSPTTDQRFGNLQCSCSSARLRNEYAIHLDSDVSSEFYA